MPDGSAVDRPDNQELEGAGECQRTDPRQERVLRARRARR